MPIYKRILEINRVYIVRGIIPIINFNNIFKVLKEELKGKTP
jgi:hypothetical protein